jgi:FkbM family methyltransferase
MKNYLRKITSYLRFNFYKWKKRKFLKNSKYFSQEGEDLFLIDFFKNKNKGFYIDVGAFHPYRINNTFALYKKGFRGINIDISATSIDLFKLARPDDINLNIGASDKAENKKFFSNKNLSFHNTFDESLAKSQGKYLRKEYQIKCKTLNQIIENTRFSNSEIDFLNIDVEGYDYQVLRGLNLKQYNPKIICIEISKLVNKKNEEYKNTKIFKYLTKNNYKLVWEGSNSYIFQINNN